jgi:hypothetical protein
MMSLQEHKDDDDDDDSDNFRNLTYLAIANSNWLEYFPSYDLKTSTR